MSNMKIFLLRVFHFSLIFSFAWRTDSYCPNKCECTDDMYDCSSKQLTTMVNMTDRNIRTLDLRNNFITQTTVLDGEFLTYLSLANNTLNKLEYDTFDNLDELKTLVLSNNSLSRITDDVFEWNPLKLEVLHLDNNQIEFIQHFLFYDLEQLTELYLQNNLITFIHSHAFLHLKKLRILRLDNNHLHTFNEKWFKALRANMFVTLLIDENPWNCDCDMGPHVKWIKQTKWFRKLTKHNELYCSKPSTLNKSPIRNLQVKSLQCDKPEITGISENTSLSINQSIELDCVVNDKKLPIPHLVWIAPNNDSYNLQTADRFEGIEVFQNGSLIVHTMKSIDFGNYTCVATSHNISVKATTTLRLIKRPSSDKPPSNKKNKPEQTKIDGGTVVHHDKTCPPGCSCIAEHVDCSSNDNMKDIPHGKIPSHTRTLTLASNQIKSVTAFRRFDYMTELRLDNNIIDSIEKQAFDKLEYLQTLTMRDNKLTTLPQKLFKRLKKLTILVMDNNQLTRIKDDTFVGLSKLQWLYIRNNLINKISHGGFAKLASIRFIHMEGNQLSSIDTQTVTALTDPKKSSRQASIKKIFVDDNQFYCDCNLKPLQLYLDKAQEWSNLFGDGVMCSYPAKLNGQYLQSVEPKQLTCNYTRVPVIQTVGGNSGGNPCVFPFEYEQNMYYKCILVKNSSFHDKVWCATTSSYTDDAQWGECKTSDYQVVQLPEKKSDSGTMSGLWFGGLILGFILCVVAVFVYKKYGHKMGIKSMTYSNLPGYDTTEEQRSLTAGGSSGTEAFV